MTPDERATNPCLNCGSNAGVDSPPSPAHCGACGDWACDDCGGVNNLATGVSCPCWLPLEGMALADIKALFADDCDGLGLSIDVEVQS